MESDAACCSNTAIVVPDLKNVDAIEECNSDTKLLTSSAEAIVQTCYIHVTGMTCASCVSRIESDLMKKNGIKSVLIALLTEKAEVQFDPSVITPAKISEHVGKLGFGAEVLDFSQNGIATVNLVIEGMTCSSCVFRIEKEIKKKRGIIEASVALATGSGSFKYETAFTGARDIITIIKNLGFNASLATEESKTAIMKKDTKKPQSDGGIHFFFRFYSVYRR